MNKALNKEEKRDGKQRAALDGWSVSYRIKAKRGQQSSWQWLYKEDSYYLYYCSSSLVSSDFNLNAGAALFNYDYKFVKVEFLVSVFYCTVESPVSSLMPSIHTLVRVSCVRACYITRRCGLSAQVVRVEVKIRITRDRIRALVVRVKDKSGRVEGAPRELVKLYKSKGHLLK